MSVTTLEEINQLEDLANGLLDKAGHTDWSANWDNELGALVIESPENGCATVDMQKRNWIAGRLPVATRATVAGRNWRDALLSAAIGSLE